MVIVMDNPSANYCVRVCVFFLMSMSTMLFIYAPKFVKMHIVKESTTIAQRQPTELEIIRSRVTRSSMPCETIDEGRSTEKESADEQA
mmetsp:Transcript_42368/g.90144  ORF Transcript_42368/g.90144 Transcript_42368/m.90144 type:complete len:88 (+) Transcript_42368:1-264(+)